MVLQVSIHGAEDTRGHHFDIVRVIIARFENEHRELWYFRQTGSKDKPSGPSTDDSKANTRAN